MRSYTLVGNRTSNELPTNGIGMSMRHKGVCPLIPNSGHGKEAPLTELFIPVFVVTLARFAYHLPLSEQASSLGVRDTSYVLRWAQDCALRS